MDSTLLERDAQVKEQRARLQPLYDEIERVLVGQRRLIDRLLMGLMTGGHVLLEGVPGLAKTLSVRSLARCSIFTIAASSSRQTFYPPTCWGR